MEEHDPQKSPATATPAQRDGAKALPIPATQKKIPFPPHLWGGVAKAPKTKPLPAKTGRQHRPQLKAQRVHLSRAMTSPGHFVKPCTQHCLMPCGVPHELCPNQQGMRTARPASDPSNAPHRDDPQILLAFRHVGKRQGNGDGMWGT